MVSPLLPVLFIHRDAEFVRLFLDHVSRQPGWTVQAVVPGVEEAMEQLRKKAVAVALIDVATVDGEGIRTFLNFRRRLKPMPCCVALGECENKLHKALQLGVDEAFMLPADMEVIADRIRRLAASPPSATPWYLTAASPPRGPLEKVVEEVLRSIGVPRHLSGYDFLLEAVTAAVRNPDLLAAVTGRLYPLIALKYGSTPRRVERAIRTCIEATWNRGNFDELDRLFSFQIDPSRAKPTNAAFIARLASEVRMRRRANGATPPEIAP